MPPYVAQVPTATTAVAFGVSRSSHSLVVIGCPVAGSLPKPHQYPSFLIASLGIEPSTTSTNGSSSPRSALKNHSRKSSAPPVGPHSKSISGQCTAILGRPGSAPSAISSILGWVAAVSATESPSQLRPALIHRTWIKVSSALTAASVGIAQLSGPGQRSLTPRESTIGPLTRRVVLGLLSPNYLVNEVLANPEAGYGFPDLCLTSLSTGVPLAINRRPAQSLM